MGDPLWTDEGEARDLQTAVLIQSHGGGTPSPPPPCYARTAYVVLNVASFCLDLESLSGISVENKQACSVLTAEPEIQLNPLLVEKALEVKVVFYRIGEWGFLQMSRVF